MSSRRDKRETTKRLAVSLELAIGALQTNIRKLKKTEGSSLLIEARKKRLARMQEELARLHH